jgi:hypothetical protein
MSEGERDGEISTTHTSTGPAGAFPIFTGAVFHRALLDLSQVLSFTLLPVLFMVAFVGWELLIGHHIDPEKLRSIGVIVGYYCYFSTAAILLYVLKQELFTRKHAIFRRIGPMFLTFYLANFVLFFQQFSIFFVDQISGRVSASTYFDGSLNYLAAVAFLFFYFLLCANESSTSQEAGKSNGLPLAISLLVSIGAAAFTYFDLVPTTTMLSVGFGSAVFSWVYPVFKEGGTGR